MSNNIFDKKNFSEMFDAFNARPVTKNAYDSAYAALSESKMKFEDANSSLKPALEHYIEPSENYKKEFTLQKTIRDAFGKSGVNYSTIAEHPDFKNLKYFGEPIPQYICTMFVDIKGSTALSLKYPLDFIYAYKNIVIQSCIECIRAFDGCVHRIMGDAVLGFFGSKEISKEQAILDCINCASVLNLYLIQTLKPSIKEKFDFFDLGDFGFRVGCNFGDDHEVLWGNYGFGLTGEVSPTGLPVDLAAKLQSLSSDNKIMLGKGLLEYFNWPKFFSEAKVDRDTHKEIIYVTPNYPYPASNTGSLDYLMMELKQDQYIKGLPFPLESKEAVIGSGLKNNQKINLICSIKESDSHIWIDYLSSSKVLKIGSKIKFKLLVDNDLSLGFPLKIKFIKENKEGFGTNHPEMMQYLYEKDEEFKEMKFDYKNAGTSYILPQEYEISRDCMYKGLHKMICEVRNSSNALIFRDIVHVPIA
ncbi:adenylate/guanylate cyclase domain-containing protein [Acinetobacter sp. ANC 4641]|uniref:adenylate/guanylate cyclase domain-containing protein n=1 Tax=Acinetobacter sp. ANC 4641 TaxID=2529847 RepID=UPI00103FFD01|nr:adenylate/guanylate cyclase domain-containing protein [Acinetobacter sp. ANC 4641]TCB09608.1 adenylate/guanylate cyclase domain-containing protein [Acinetobacter sp. ANC 4641]